MQITIRNERLLALLGFERADMDASAFSRAGHPQKRAPMLVSMSVRQWLGVVLTRVMRAGD
jgi:hypothetical protein